MKDNNDNKEQVFEKAYDPEAIVHHDFDGIKEYHNPSPYWIVFLFIFSIGFALTYAVRYFGHPGNQKDQISEYNQQVADFEQQRASKQGGTGVALDDKQAIAMGEKLYQEKGCIACHGTKGEGNAIGPNLTDNYWINGCKKEQVVAIITNGKPEKGMTPFKSTMTPQQIEAVTTYILKSLQGSNPPNGKAPQGEECK